MESDIWFSKVMKFLIARKYHFIWEQGEVVKDGMSGCDDHANIDPSQWRPAFHLHVKPQFTDVIEYDDVLKIISFGFTLQYIRNNVLEFYILYEDVQSKVEEKEEDPYEYWLNMTGGEET